MEYEEYERPDISVMPLDSEGGLIASSADDDAAFSNDEIGSNYWSPFGFDEGIPD